MKPRRARLKSHFADLVAAAFSASLVCVAFGCSSDDTTTAPAIDSGTRQLDATHAPSEHEGPKPDVTSRPPETGAPEASSTDGGGDARSDANGSAAVFVVGKGCAKDADCAAGLTCLKPSDNIAPGVGGPAGGYCSKERTPKSNDAGPLTGAQALCAALDQASICVE